MATSQMRAKGGAEASLNLCLPTSLLGLEGQRTLKLEERIVELFDELRLPVFRYLLCLSVSPEEADEVIQDTFLRLYKHLRSGGRDDNLRSWIFRVAHNTALNQLKGRRHFAPAGPDQWVELNELSADPAPNPEELLLRKERMIRLHAAMSTLSAQQLQCVHLRAEGFRYREIAELLGVTVSTVAESLRRAIDKLTRESHG
jgi:RNA polymerase sigma-70 factor, ECF subfamily